MSDFFPVDVELPSIVDIAQQAVDATDEESFFGLATEDKLAVLADTLDSLRGFENEATSLDGDELVSFIMDNVELIAYNLALITAGFARYVERYG